MKYQRPPEQIPEPLADRLARSRDRLGVLASNVLFFPTIGSTNDLASGVEGTVVFADEQTAGRGRRGHVWFSPPLSGLYVSVVLTPSRSIDPNRAMRLLTLAAGVALAEAIETHTGLSVDLKWPNDLYFRNKKLGGILAEARTSVPDTRVVRGASASAVRTDTPLRRSVLDTREGHGPSVSARGGGAPRELENVVLGYGINVRATSYPSDISDRATSLETELGTTIDRYDLLVETLAALSARYEDLVAGRFDVILDAWRRRAPGACGARVKWTTNSGPQVGVTAGIDENGALLVQVDDGVETIVGGEVCWL
jgi:BirA family biotin operon repressor/biotin-[acetyl-CoA-carboxylase] ligase